MEKKEYIERGAAVDELRRRTKMIGELIAMECDSDLLKKVLNIYYNAREEAAKVIEEVPAADVVKVVRCKDCKLFEELHYENEGEPPRIKMVCRLFKRQMYSDDFCSYGEKREEGENE